MASKNVKFLKIKGCGASFLGLGGFRGDYKGKGGVWCGVIRRVRLNFLILMGYCDGM